MAQQLDNLIVDSTNGLAVNTERYSSTLVSLASLTIVKSTSGFFNAVTFCAPSCPTIAFYDHASGPSGAIIGTFNADSPRGSYLIGTSFSNGLVVSVLPGVAPQVLVNKR